MRVPVFIVLLVAGTAVAVGEVQRSKRPEFQPRRVLGPLPPITNPPLQAAKDAGELVSDSELVIGVKLDGAARAYPINMLTGPRREIINDRLAGTAIAATW